MEPLLARPERLFRPHALGDFLNEAAHADDAAVLGPERVVIVQKRPEEARTGRGFQLGHTFDEGLARLDHTSKVTPDGGRHIQDHVLDSLSQVGLDRQSVQRGQPPIDVAVAQVRVEVAQADGRVLVHAVQEHGRSRSHALIHNLWSLRPAPASWNWVRR